MPDLRDARFYVIEGDGDAASATAQPLEFSAAFDKARDLTEDGRRIKVLYIEDATQTEIARSVHEGMPTELFSGG